MSIGSQPTIKFSDEFQRNEALTGKKRMENLVRCSITITKD